MNKTDYDPQANLIYQENPESLTSTRVMEFINHHDQHQKPRLIMLDHYYKGLNGVIFADHRRTEEGKADYRIAHPFAKYIADFQTAYSVGNPITMQVDGTSNDALDAVNDANDVDAENYSLFLDVTRFGRAFELIYRDKSDTEKFVRLDPIDTFMIYDLSVDPQPIMAVRYHKLHIVTGGTTKEQLLVETWTEDEHIKYPPTDINAELVSGVSETAYGVQVVEYKNNDFRLGDYEPVIPLIDAYDAAESDTANYMNDLNDAMLVLQGDIDSLFDGADLMTDPDDKEAMTNLAKAKMQVLQEMKKANLLLLRSGINSQGQQTNVSAGYIYKQYDVNGTEAYKKRIADDIHKFSHTPNLTDENFAANVSGVAMKYKLLGTVELAAIKRRSFERGLNQRYAIVSAIEAKAGSGWDADPDQIDYTFTDNLPADDISQIQAIVQAGATLPQSFLLKYLPGVTDTQELLDELQKEREQSPYNAMLGGAVNESSTDGEEAKPEAGEAGQGQQQGTESPN